MYLKVVLLLSISAALAYHLQDTPDDLEAYFKDINGKVRSLHHSTLYKLRTDIVPLGWYIDEARTFLIGNISVAAQPYWASIKVIEETAEATGQDVSQCVSIGNNQLYALNNTIVATARVAFDYYYKSGDEIIISSYSMAHSVIRELDALEEVVPLCHDDTCATELMKVVTQYFERTKATLIDAETKASNYVFVYLPDLLALQSLDSHTYVANYTVFLNDVALCINNL